MTPQQSWRGRRAHRAAGLGCLAALLMLVGCGLENEPGALGSWRPDPAHHSEPAFAGHSSATPAIAAEAESTPTPNSRADGWYAVEMTEQLLVSVPGTPGWQLVEQRTLADGSARLQLANQMAGVQITVQIQRLTPGQSAAQACSAGLQDQLTTEAELRIVSLGNPAPGASWVAAASCAVTGVASELGPLDYRLDVALRAAEGIAYLQLLQVAPGGQSSVRDEAISMHSEILRRAIDQLDRR